MVVTVILNKTHGSLVPQRSITHSSYDTYSKHTLTRMKIKCVNGVQKMPTKENKVENKVGPSQLAPKSDPPLTSQGGPLTQLASLGQHSPTNLN